MGLFGGSSSSSSSLQNSLAFNPIINVGDANKNDSTTRQKGSSDATATAKDEFGMSAGFALGPNSNASGGPVSGIGDLQPMNKKTDKGDGGFFKDGKSINPLYLVLGVGGTAVAYYYMKKKRK